MEIEFINKEERKFRFLIKGTEHTFVNSLRRILVSEIPILAIDYLNIYENTSILFDEQLALRFGLIPLVTDLDSYILPEDCSCEGGCFQCQVRLSLMVEGPTTVYSKDLFSDEDSEIVPADKDIPLVKLKKDQKIFLEAIAKLGKGRDNVKWQSTIAVGYKNLPEVVITDCDQCGDCIKICPRNILKFDDDKVYAENVIECSLCRLCENECHLGEIKVNEAPDAFIFTFDTTGALSPEKILETGLDILSEKAKNLKKIMQEYV